VGMWGMLFSTVTRGKLRKRKQQPDIEYFNIVSACKLCLLYCIYVRINAHPIIKTCTCLCNVGQFSTMPATQLRNQSTLTAEESMLQSPKEYSFIFLVHTYVVLSRTYVASWASSVRSKLTHWTGVITTPPLDTHQELTSMP